MNTSLERIAGVLGIAPQNRTITPMFLVEQVARGLPFATLARVYDEVAPGEPDLRYKVISRATLARKQSANQRLSPEQSDRVARVARVWTLAKEVWQSPVEARAFLLRPHAVLEGRRPIDVTLTTEGARLVEGILGRLLYGSAA